ncbi:hypothetical protein [Apilactobacillus bombintestini]|nr:hypothetical protein [Apilactobacillus bombintestini]
MVFCVSSLDIDDVCTSLLFESILLVAAPDLMLELSAFALDEVTGLY